MKTQEEKLRHLMTWFQAATHHNNINTTWEQTQMVARKLLPYYDLWDKNQVNFILTDNGESVFSLRIRIPAPRR